MNQPDYVTSLIEIRFCKAISRLITKMKQTIEKKKVCLVQIIHFNYKFLNNPSDCNYKYKYQVVRLTHDLKGIHHL